ncbi:hypothetical protein AB0M42_10205 [Streptomyces sp. NPDC051784]|uniref:hypothetical protein n=1 Tax=Streptomyces sp. NPDC051784 TaxID=3155805 RepID=UPI003428A7D7
MEYGNDERDVHSRPVRDLVRSVVAAVAPAESPLVDGLCRFDDATVVRRLRRGGGRREPLGFGIGEVAALAAPVVWLVLDGVAQQFATTTATSVSTKLRGMARRMSRRPAPVMTVPALTREQMLQVRTQVLAMAQHRGLPADRAEEIADAVVARLVLSDSSDTPTREPSDDPEGEDPAPGQG